MVTKNLTPNNQPLFSRLLNDNITFGSLTLHLPGEKRYDFGAGAPHVHWHFRSIEVLKRIAVDWEFELGETYVEGGWYVSSSTSSSNDYSSLIQLLEILMRNFPERIPTGFEKLIRILRKPLQQWNKIKRSIQNVSHHYDKDESFYRSFLDNEMHYSCAYFYNENISLEEAQLAKCKYIANKLILEPGQHVLDIGCGWGSMAIYLAKHANVNVTGITLSETQLHSAQKRAASEGLSNQVKFELCDYRKHTGQYDRIVSVGMYEHVGRPNYMKFAAKVKSLLNSDGIMLLHTIGRLGPAGTTNPWIQKYIFPGGYIPALSEITKSLEKNFLFTEDMEVLRLHYAMTLAAWSKRFEKNRSVIHKKYGEKFCRLWEFYLAVCEGSFRWWDLAVFQIQLSPSIDAVPVTRDYLYQQPLKTSYHELKKA